MSNSPIDGSNRRLTVVVCGRGQPVAALRDRLHTAVQSAASSDFDPAWVEVDPVEIAEPSREAAGRCHLVVGHRQTSSWTDVSLAAVDEAPNLVLGRLIPWVSRWRVGRRAPRVQVARLLDPDPVWPPVAERLRARLERATVGRRVLRIDHIGSTSVPGIKAKDLIDLQITVPTIADAAPVAAAVTAAGFVHVAGPLSGKDRSGVDADPGRPVNINIRSADAPVARDTVLFRDWLRANDDARLRYEAFKAARVGWQIDDYGDAKEPFIAACLDEAEDWAAASSWSGFEDLPCPPT